MMNPEPELAPFDSTETSFDQAMLRIRAPNRPRNAPSALQELDLYKLRFGRDSEEIQRIRIFELNFLVSIGKVKAVEAIVETSALLDAAVCSEGLQWQVEAYLLQAAVRRGSGMRASGLAAAVTAVELSERLGDEDLLVIAVAAQAFALNFMVEGARAFVEKWLNRTPCLPPDLIFGLHSALGTAEYYAAEQSGDLQLHARAIKAHTQGLMLALQQGNVRLQAVQHMNISINAGLMGDLNLAADHLQSFDQLYQHTLSIDELAPPVKCWTAFCRGMVTLGRGRADEAFALLLKARADAQVHRLSCLAPLIKIQDLLLKHAVAFNYGQHVASWVSDLTRLHQELGGSVLDLSTSFEELVKSAQTRGENRVLRSHGDALTRELAASNLSLQDTIRELRVEVARRERAEAELQRVNEELELRVLRRTTELQAAQASIAGHERMAALSRLVSGLAHRLNTPLGNARMVVSGLSGACEQFEEELGKGLSKRELTEFIDLTRQTADLAERALKQASELMRVFKQVSTLEHVEEAQCFEPGLALQECCDSMQEELKLQTVVPLFLQLRDCPLCFGYLQVLAQVLKQLIANAMQHGQPEQDGTGRPGVWITQELQGDQLQISVRDEGPGIAPDRRPSIFEPFNNKLNASGLGLGLHIARNLTTDLLQGQLTVTSVSGHGCCFLLSLPLRVNEAASNFPAFTKVP